MVSRRLAIGIDIRFIKAFSVLELLRLTIPRCTFKPHLVPVTPQRAGIVLVLSTGGCSFHCLFVLGISVLVPT